MRRLPDIIAELGESIVWLGWRIRGPRRLPPDTRTIEQAERAIVNRRFEIACVFDQEGRQVFRQEGTSEGLDFAADDLAHLRDAIVVHNHPPYRHYRRSDPRYQGGTLSATDLAFAIQYDVFAIRAVTPGWRYVSVRPIGGWPADADTIRSMIRETRVRVDSDLVLAVATGRMTVAEAQGYASDEVVRRVAQAAGFSYEATRIQ